jgi:hypothetical protein
MRSGELCGQAPMEMFFSKISPSNILETGAVCVCVCVCVSACVHARHSIDLSEIEESDFVLV